MATQKNAILLRNSEIESTMFNSGVKVKYKKKCRSLKTYHLSKYTLLLTISAANKPDILLLTQTEKNVFSLKKLQLTNG